MTLLMYFFYQIKLKMLEKSLSINESYLNIRWTEWNFSDAFQKRG